MPSAIDIDAIDTTKPHRGKASTADVRQNFAAVKAGLDTAKAEITALQAGGGGGSGGGETAASIAAIIHGAGSKAAPVDADELPLVDSSTSGLAKITWNALKTALGAFLSEFYAAVASPAFTGVPSAPTAAADTDTTQLATTAFVLGQAAAAGDGLPAMDGPASRGVSLRYARSDHVHPTDAVLVAKAGGTMAGDLGMAGYQIAQPKLRDIRETAGTAAFAGGTLTLDLATGNHFAHTLTANVTAVTISNVPATGQYVPVTVELTQDATGGRTVAGWPAGAKWPGGTVPAMTSAANAVDIVTGYTRDGGTTWRLGRAHADSK